MMSLDKNLDLAQLRRLIYLCENKIKGTKWTLENKKVTLSGEDQAKMVKQIEFDEQIIETLKGEL